MVLVSELNDLLQSHGNRDKVVSLASYILKLWGATSKEQSLLLASGRLVAARACLRLFDDASALEGCLSYGLGRHEGTFWGTMGVAGNASTLAYLQAEKLVWLLDCKLITLSEANEGRCRVAHKLFWSLLATFGLIRSIKALHTTGTELQSPNPKKCATARFTQASLATTKMLFDVIHSVSWLPEGWLWGGRLDAKQMGGVGLGSAVLALVMHYHGKRFESR